MDLITARFITNKTQMDVQRGSGVNQGLISLFERTGSGMSKKCQDAIDRYFGIKLDWNMPRALSLAALDAEEKEDLKQFLYALMKVKGEDRVVQWAMSYKTARQLYNASVQVINAVPITIAPLEPDWKKK